MKKPDIGQVIPCAAPWWALLGERLAGREKVTPEAHFLSNACLE
jgi:hypothetical protein